MNCPAVVSALLAAVVLAGCGGTENATPTSSDSPTPSSAASRLPGRFFAPDGVWNTPIAAGVALDPTSDARTAALAEQARTIGSMINTDRYSTPIYTVDADQPTVRVRLDTHNQDLERAVASVPLPADARAATGTDHHLVVWQPSTDTMWEFWRLRHEPDGWRAGYAGRMTDVQENPGYYRRVIDADNSVVEQPWWGATATSLPLVGGLITFRDLRQGRIDHALALGVPQVESGVKAFPAQRSDGRFSGLTSIPEGARLRLDPTLDIHSLGLPPTLRAIAVAAQRYGLIVRDGSSAVSLYGQDPTPLAQNPYPALFSGLRPYKFAALFPWNRLQLMKMQLTPYTG
ncbi:MAG TPA: hypothetical protein VN756_12660 [Solirubrobacterales bacterium]|nr:hypothetical protein [Solirubrobacterales bacterium]